jgi:diguanylate cyclase (GGDEF)-like protein
MEKPKLRKRFDDVATFFARYMKKLSRAYIIVLSLIMLFECAMMARGLIRFDFSVRICRLYMAAYVFLFFASLIALIFILRNRRDRVSPRAVTIALHLYCTAIIAWSLLISWLDLTAGHTPVVYLTVIQSVAGLSCVYPAYYLINLVISLGVLFYVSLIPGIAYFEGGSGGTFINLSILVIVSMLLAIRNFSNSRHDLAYSDHLTALSYRDHLTGAFNRRMFEEDTARLDAADAEALIGMLDLDAFKTLNDTYGHDFGDVCLREFARLLREAFGEQVYRFGGDEFVVICAPDAPERLSQRVDAINAALAEAFPKEPVSTSAGFALRAQGSGTPSERVTDEADEALYDAKNGGKRRCCFGKSVPV